MQSAAGKHVFKSRASQNTTEKNSPMVTTNKRRATTEMDTLKLPGIKHSVTGTAANEVSLRSGKRNSVSSTLLSTEPKWRPNGSSRITPQSQSGDSSTRYPANPRKVKGNYDRCDGVEPKEKISHVTRIQPNVVSNRHSDPNAPTLNTVNSRKVKGNYGRCDGLEPMEKILHVTRILPNVASNCRSDYNASTLNTLPKIEPHTQSEWHPHGSSRNPPQLPTGGPLNVSHREMVDYGHGDYMEPKQNRLLVPSIGENVGGFCPVNLSTSDRLDSEEGSYVPRSLSKEVSSRMAKNYAASKAKKSALRKLRSIGFNSTELLTGVPLSCFEAQFQKPASSMSTESGVQHKEQGREKFSDDQCPIPPPADVECAFDIPVIEGDFRLLSDHSLKAVAVTASGSLLVRSGKNWEFYFFKTDSRG